MTEYNGMNVLNGTYQDNSGTGSSGETWYGSGPNSLFNANSSSSNPGALDYYDQYQPGTDGHSDPHGTNGPASVNVDGPADNKRGHWRLQIGADNDINNQHEFSVMNATANGLDLNIDKSVGTVAEFQAAIANGDIAVYVDSSGKFVGGDEAGATQLVVEDVSSTDTLLVGSGGKAVTNVGRNSSDQWVVSDDTGGIGTAIGDSTLGDVDAGEGLNDADSDDFGWKAYDANVRGVNAARSAVTRLDAAIDEINRERSYVGSEQNKLQFTMSNLTSNIQSIESARSSIEDVDFAAEAADLAKNQILVQSGTAMLAQAAAISQNILGLLA